ncbi:metallophosphoesterase [Catenulispora yoronensis]
MKVAFIGDVHGCVLHALGSVLMLQQRRGVRLDAVVQVGDLGAYPSADRFDGPSRRFILDSPSQGDFFRLLDPTPELAASVRGALEQMPPVLFVAGNHEDHEWLASLHAASAGAGVVAVDPLGAFHHVECGRVVDVAGLRTAFLGLMEAPGKMDLDEAAYAALLAAEPGSVDLLITHEGPTACPAASAEVQGSPKLTRLIEHLQPPLHISGHVHHENGRGTTARPSPTRSRSSSGRSPPGTSPRASTRSSGSRTAASGCSTPRPEPSSTCTTPGWPRSTATTSIWPGSWRPARCEG